MLPRILIRRIIPTLRITSGVPANFKLNLTISTNNKNIAVVRLPQVQSHQFSTSVKSNDLATVDYDYVKRTTSDKAAYIVDVREPDDVKEHGKIPNSINIPLADITTVLRSMPDKEFEQKYNKSKPSKNSEIIFYCMIGKRSGKAQQEAFNAGYKNVKNYLGSWNDWATKQS